MERFYDGDQEQLFAEARVINPFRKPALIKQKVNVASWTKKKFKKSWG